MYKSLKHAIAGVFRRAEKEEYITPYHRFEIKSLNQYEELNGTLQLKVFDPRVKEPLIMILEVMYKNKGEE